MANPIIEEFVEKGLAGKASTTKKTYKHVLESFETWLQGAGANLKDFARSDVQQYIDYMVAKKKSAVTVNKEFQAIKKFCFWLGKKEAIEDINLIKPPQQKAPRALDRVERNRLIREVDRKGSKRDYAIVMVLLNTGLRLTELVNLDRQDIETSERKGHLLVRNGKGNWERKIPLNAETRRAIEKYLDERDDKEKALFLSNRGKRISPRSVQHLLNLYGFSVHQLRHTFITALVREGKDIATIQALSGHKSADMVMRYSLPSEEDLEDAVEGIYKGK